MINNLIEDLSRLDPLDKSRGLNARIYNRYDANYTMETEFHSSGSINTGPTGTGGSSGNGMSKRRLSLVSNSSRTSHQPHYSASSTVTVPPIAEKQPGITEQVISKSFVYALISNPAEVCVIKIQQG